MSSYGLYHRSVYTYTNFLILVYTWYNFSTKVIPGIYQILVFASGIYYVYTKHVYTRYITGLYHVYFELNWLLDPDPRNAASNRVCLSNSSSERYKHRVHTDLFVHAADPLLVVPWPAAGATSPAASEGSGPPQPSPAGTGMFKSSSRAGETGGGWTLPQCEGASCPLAPTTFCKSSTPRSRSSAAFETPRGKLETDSKSLVGCYARKPYSRDTWNDWAHSNGSSLWTYWYMSGVSPILW